MFDGREFARKKMAELSNLHKTPTMVSIYDNTDPGSVLYTKLKKQAAESIGVKFVDYDINGKTYEEVAALIAQANRNSEVKGILVQLPLLEPLTSLTTQIIDLIDPQKDVDGMRADSPFVTPVAKAVGYILRESPRGQITESQVVVVGAGGFEGSRIVKYLRNLGFNHILGCDKKTKDLSKETRLTNILISATGQPGLIHGDMIKEGAVIIDVGSPQGDVVTSEILPKASFISPVPGGVGPVTIACLLENLLLK
jgi:methylenetetrahydrofolate dehydrogenase (NADP+)/methenyltetrahydrofolate cyclohydrolase